MEQMFDWLLDRSSPGNIHQVQHGIAIKVVAEYLSDELIAEFADAFGLKHLKCIAANLPDLPDTSTVYIFE